MTKEQTASPDIPAFTAEFSELDGPLSGVVVSLAGEVDIATVGALVDGLSVVAETTSSVVIIDASQITFMDSAGVHALIDAKRNLHHLDTQIILICSPAVRRVLDIAHPGRLFAERVDTMEQALALVDGS